MSLVIVDEEIQRFKGMGMWSEFIMWPIRASCNSQERTNIQKISGCFQSVMMLRDTPFEMGSLIPSPKGQL